MVRVWASVLSWGLTIVGGDRERWVATRRGRGRDCAPAAPDQARLGGLSTAPLGVGMVRVWASVLSWAAVPVILYGALFLTAAGVEAYMVAFGGARPGDMVFPDFPATPLKESLIEMGIGAGIIAVGLFARSYARRLRLAGS